VLHQRARGFTLIELMIVVTVIGTLAAISVPFYLGYITRAKVAEGMTLAAPAQAAISTRFAEYGTFPSDNTDAGLPLPAANGGEYVKSVEVQPAGVIVVTFGDPALLNQVITLTPLPGAPVQWVCTTSLPSNLKPKDCG
jgi:type IV pilus assembly protein PilA